jgi:hypothetical protein
MARALVGAVVGAIAMFIIGFIFFATPMNRIGTASLDNAQAAAVQQAMAANLPKAGTYYIPSADSAEQAVMYGQGPIATVHYNTSGFSAADPAVMIGGFIHMLVVALLMAVGLFTLSRYVPSFGERVRLLLLGTIGAAAFMRLGEPIWYHHDWSHAIYMFVADVVSLSVAGLIILKMLPRASGAAATAAHVDAPTDV